MGVVHAEFFCQAGMTGGDVEATGRTDELAFSQHALQHFAHALVAVADACGNGAGFGGKIPLQLVGEDGLALSGEGA